MYFARKVFSSDEEPNEDQGWIRFQPNRSDPGNWMRVIFAGAQTSTGQRMVEARFGTWQPITFL